LQEYAFITKAESFINNLQQWWTNSP